MAKRLCRSGIGQANAVEGGLQQLYGGTHGPEQGFEDFGSSGYVGDVLGESEDDLVSVLAGVLERLESHSRILEDLKVLCSTSSSSSGMELSPASAQPEQLRQFKQ